VSDLGLITPDSVKLMSEVGKKYLDLQSRVPNTIVVGLKLGESECLDTLFSVEKGKGYYIHRYYSTR